MQLDCGRSCRVDGGQAARSLHVDRQLTFASKEGLGRRRKAGYSDVREAEVVEMVLSRQLGELELRLTRRGCSMRRTPSEQFSAKPTKIKRLLRSELDAVRTRELTSEMRAAGLLLRGPETHDHCKLKH